VEVVYSAHYKL